MRRFLLILACACLGAVSLAQTKADKVINLASEHIAFKQVLAARNGWYARAYDPYTRYGVWRVQFWDAEGNNIAWAMVDPETRQLYSWDYDTGLNDTEFERAKEVLTKLVTSNSNVLDVVGDINPDELRFGIDESKNLWWVRFERGSDMVTVTFRPEVSRARTTDNLVLDRIFFPRTPSFAEWQSGHEASIIAIAFREKAIAKALRGNENWTSQIEALKNNLWAVRFMDGEKELARAEVNLEKGMTVDFSVNQ